MVYRKVENEPVCCSFGFSRNEPEEYRDMSEFKILIVFVEPDRFLAQFRQLQTRFLMEPSPVTI